MKDDLKLDLTKEKVKKYAIKLIISTIILLATLVIENEYITKFVESKAIIDFIKLFYDLIFITIMYFSYRLYSIVRNNTNKIIGIIVPIIMIFICALNGNTMIIVILYLLFQSRKFYKSKSEDTL